MASAQQSSTKLKKTLILPLSPTSNRNVQVVRSSQMLRTLFCNITNKHQSALGEEKEGSSRLKDPDRPCTEEGVRSLLALNAQAFHNALSHRAGAFVTAVPVAVVCLKAFQA